MATGGAERAAGIDESKLHGSLPSQTLFLSACRSRHTSARRSLEADRALASSDQEHRGKGKEERTIHQEKKINPKSRYNLLNACARRQIEDDYCPTDPDYAKNRVQGSQLALSFCVESVFSPRG